MSVIYVVLDDSGYGLLVGEKPDGAYFEIEENELPRRIIDHREGYEVKLFADMENQTVWWDWVKVTESTGSSGFISTQVSNLTSIVETLVRGLLDDGE